MNKYSLLATAMLVCASASAAPEPTPSATPSATPSPSPAASPSPSATPTASATPDFAITPDLSAVINASTSPSPAEPSAAAKPAATSLKNKKASKAAQPVESRSISLESAYDMTLSCDQSIRRAYYEIRKANLQPWSALTKLGPSISANAGYSNNRTSTRYSDTSIQNNVISNVGSGYTGFSYSQTLFDASVFPAYRYGKLAARASRLTQRNTIRSILYSLSQAYYNVLKEQKLVQVYQQTLDLANEQLVTAQAKFDAGTVARIDVLRAQATVEDARNILIQAQGTLDTYKDTLSNILNLKGRTNFCLMDPPDETDPSAPYEQSLKSALDKREDLKVSQIQVEQSKAVRGEVLAQYAPRITANASTQWGSYTGGSTNRDHVETASIGVSVPVFTGGQRELDLIAARHNISEAELSYESTWKNVEADVKTAWINVQTSREAIKALKAAEASYAQNYTDVQAKYQEGTATSLDVQEALRDLNSARANLTNQVYDYQIYLRNLKRAEAIFQEARVESLRVK